MDTPLTILHLEDDPPDSELVLKLLRAGGLPVNVERVDTFAAYHAALAGEFGYALILSDFSVPGVDPVEALRAARQLRPEVPFIFLSGMIEEGMGVEMLHLGASDYVLKQRMAGLVPAVRRALREAGEQRRRKRAEAALRESEERFRTLADNIPHLAWMADPAGNIFWFNRRWLEFTGASAEEMRGWGWQKIPHPDYLERVVAKIGRCFATGEEWEDTFPMRRWDGEYCWFLSRAKPIRDEDGSIVRWFGTNTDITEQLKAEQTLKEAKEAAEAGNRAKDRFLLNMSHEMRTPLTVIMGMLELALAGELAVEQRRYVEAAYGSSETLLALIKDLLDLSGIEKGDVLLQEAPFDLHRCIREAVEPFVARAGKKGIDLQLEIAPETPREVTGDCGRLMQILQNLVGNAVRFTEHGAVRIAVAAAAKVGGKGEISFVVRDTGVGIPPEAAASLFEKFTQADESLTRRFGGAGLGLAICRGLVERMGGRIAMESTSGEGSRFSFTLPLPGVASARQLDAGPTGSAESSLSILVVEDEPLIAQMVQIFLSREGWSIDIAEDGRAAVEKWEKGRYDLILMDLQMPGIDGLEATRMIRERERENNRHIPIIAMTAHARQEDEKSCRAAGMDGFVRKPIQWGQLRRIIQLHAPSAAIGH
ncbi:MAG: response regulator [Desulfuromonadales bacterium]